MSWRCDLTGKKPLVGHKVSHSNIKTKRRFMPNLRNVTLISDALGRKVRVRVSANALKTVDHRGGLDAFLLKAKDDELAPKMLELKRADREEEARKAAPSATVRRAKPRSFRFSNCMPRASRRRIRLHATAHSPTSANCSSRLRWMTEKLSSDTSVRMVSPAALRCTAMPSMLSIW